MFERNKVDNAAPPSVPVSVEIECDDRTVVKGRLIISGARTLAEVLNGSGQFIEFEPYDGPRRLVSKSIVRSIQTVNVPDARQLAARRREIEGFDPHSVLGVAADAPFDEVRNAYVRLSKIYHPDRYQSMELPPEVREYLAAMAARINIAYGALEKLMVAEKSRAAARSEPIYTSRPRA
jgi:hypothetical protein